MTRLAHLSNVYRSRALACEQRAKQTFADPIVKEEWEDLAIQWHMMSNVAAQAADKRPQVDLYVVGGRVG
jgi:hypothetical protein